MAIALIKKSGCEMPKPARIETQKARLIRRRKERGMCYRCGKRPPMSDVGICKQCSVKWNARRLLHKTRYNAVHRNTRERVRREVFEAYGGCHCACCGESHIEFMSIDHIEGWGAAHRSQHDMAMRGGSEFYRWLQKNGYPRGYQVLCMNCNIAKRQSDSCPHRRARGERRHVQAKR